jgi:hypothetical protein
MTIFRLSTVIGVWEKKFGKEEISIEFTEWEIASLLKACKHWNKKLYVRIKNELIEEAKKEGYNISIDPQPIKVKCPTCKGEVKI